MVGEGADELAAAKGQPLDERQLIEAPVQGKYGAGIAGNARIVGDMSAIAVCRASPPASCGEIRDRLPDDRLLAPTATASVSPATVRHAEARRTARPPAISSAESSSMLRPGRTRWRVRLMRSGVEVASSIARTYAVLPDVDRKPGAALGPGGVAFAVM